MMESGFTRKKVESLTLGEKLRKLRGDFRMSLAEVSKATRIQVKYLEFLENGQYEKLPADVYVRGFLRSYARYLNIDEQALVRLYEREHHIQKNLGRGSTKSLSTYAFTPSPIIVTTRSLAVGAIVLLVLGAFFYLYREFKSFAADPALIILEPKNGSVVESQELAVRGKTDKGARVSLNNQIVFVDEQGIFSGKLFLQPGINIVLVRTVNRFDKEKSATFSVDARYVPASPTPEVDQTPTADASKSYPISVTARTLPLTVTITSNNTTIFSGSLAPQETKTFEVEGMVEITSDRGEATFVAVDGRKAEPLAREKGAAKSVPFTQSGKFEGE